METESKLYKFMKSPITLNGGNFISGIFISAIISLIVTLFVYIDEEMSRDVVGFFAANFIVITIISTIINIIADGKSGKSFTKILIFGWVLFCFLILLIPSEESYTIGETIAEMIILMVVFIPIHFIFVFYRTKGLHDENHEQLPLQK